MPKIPGPTCYATVLDIIMSVAATACLPPSLTESDLLDLSSHVIAREQVVNGNRGGVEFEVLLRPKKGRTMSLESVEQGLTDGNLDFDTRLW